MRHAIQLGHRDTARPFAFVGSDGQPAGYSVDPCLHVASALKQTRPRYRRGVGLRSPMMSWARIVAASRTSGCAGTT
jgi:ABC-type amino acid transport substrate-binding protein